MKKKIFIQSNEKQLLGAKVAKYSFEKHLSDKSIEVEIMLTNSFPLISQRAGKLHLRKGVKTIWKDDLQSFTPLRFLPPQLMNFQGRALVVDPDVFALVDVSPLFEMDMKGKAIYARKINSNEISHWATSVMLLDCAKLRHWQWEECFEKIFSFDRDYRNWMNLEYENQETIGELESTWNDYDRLEKDTRLLHTTRRITQPWKTGLPIDFSVSEKKRPKPKTLLEKIKFKLGLLTDLNEPQKGLYLPHPDKNQEIFFYKLLKESLEKNAISKIEIFSEIKKKNIRPDSVEILEKI